MFKDENCFREVMASGKLSAELIAQLYRVDRKQVRFWVIESLLTVKISIPRPVFSGDVDDTDVYGGQFHGPLVRLPVEAGFTVLLASVLNVGRASSLEMSRGNW